MERKKTLKANISDLVAGFYNLKTRNDVAALLEISDKKLRYWIYKASDNIKYSEFKIPKKNGEFRNISAPIGSYKLLQRNLAFILYLVHKSKFCSYGFEKNVIIDNEKVFYKNIITNAKNHVNRKYVLNIDIKDFFPSINFGRVRGLFEAKPFNFNQTVATILAQICCHNGYLPQGAPTSPVISNMICRRLDNELVKYITANKCTYSRYADDITISTNQKELPETIYINDYLSSELEEIIKSNGFNVNTKKVYLMLRNERQEVSGIKVNKKLNVSRLYIKKIRAMLHNWENFGLEGAISRFNSCESIKLKKDFKKVLFGRIDFLKQVRGEEDEIYIKLWNKFQILNGAKHKIKSIIREEKNNELFNIIENGENYRTEFKESFQYCQSVDNCIKKLYFKNQYGQEVESPKYRILKAITAFLNSEEGGIIIVGVEDQTKRHIGLEGDLKNCTKGIDELENTVMGWLDSYISPTPFNKVLLTFHRLKRNIIICKITVKPSKEPSCLIDKEKNSNPRIFTRHGNTSRELNSLDVKEWMREHDKFAFKCPNS
jgi:RNA-directed DNA polymerase